MKHWPRLVFVYNADSGFFNTVVDIGHKLISPDTYQCQLCALSHGYFSEREAWRNLVEALRAECTFLHRDEFRRQFPGNDTRLPAVFLRNGDDLTVCLDAPELEDCAVLDDLERKIRQHCLPRADAS